MLYLNCSSDIIWLVVLSRSWFIVLSLAIWSLLIRHELLALPSVLAALMRLSLSLVADLENVAEKKTERHGDEEEESHEADRNLVQEADTVRELCVFARVQFIIVFAYLLELWVGKVAQGKHKDSCREEYSECNAQGEIDVVQHFTIENTLLVDGHQNKEYALYHTEAC